MEIGKLRHCIDLQSFVETADEYNQPIKHYETFATVDARIEPIQGRELLEAQKLNSRVTHRITIRHQEFIEPLDRILFDTRILEPVSVLDVDERRIEMKIMCIEQVAPRKQDAETI